MSKSRSPASSAAESRARTGALPRLDRATVWWEGPLPWAVRGLSVATRSWNGWTSTTPAAVVAVLGSATEATVRVNGKGPAGGRGALGRRKRTLTEPSPPAGTVTVGGVTHPHAAASRSMVTENSSRAVPVLVTRTSQPVTVSASTASGRGTTTAFTPMRADTSPEVASGPAGPGG
jgi:hypothetical protein